jgi:hypothetical protein
MSNQLGQIYGSVKNAETYIILNSENVELSGNVYINGSINQNVDISGNLNISGGLAIDNSFGISGEVLTSQGSTSSPIWSSIPTPVIPALGHAYFIAAGGQSLTAGSDNTVAFSITDQNTMTAHLDRNSGSSSEFKVKTAGAYRIDAQLWIAHTSVEMIGCYLFIYHNNSVIAQARFFTGQIFGTSDWADFEYFTLNTFRIKTFAVNDLIKIVVRPHITSGNNSTVTGGATGINGNGSMVSFMKL